MTNLNQLYYNPDIQICKEITDWDTPNHIYYINRAEKMVAYRSAQGEKKIFKRPLMFSKARRKFYIMKDFGFPNGSRYVTTANSCTCKGFMFRKSCKHVNELRGEMK